MRVRLRAHESERERGDSSHVPWINALNSTWSTSSWFTVTNYIIWIFKFNYYLLLHLFIELVKTLGVLDFLIIS